MGRAVVPSCLPITVQYIPVPYRERLEENINLNFKMRETHGSGNLHRRCRAPSGPLLARLLWALRTACASLLSYLLLFTAQGGYDGDDLPLPIPVLGVVFAIFMTGANVGSTLLIFRIAMLSSAIGLAAGGVVSNLLRSFCAAETFASLLPLVAFVGTLGLMSVPPSHNPMSTLAVLFYILCLGLRRGPKWHVRSASLVLAHPAAVHPSHRGLSCCAGILPAWLWPC